VPTDVQRFLTEFTDAYLAFYPSYASGMGLHQYDGQITDLSPTSIASRVASLEEYRQRLAALDRSRVSPQEDLDLDLVGRSINAEHFDWTELQDHLRNPLAYNYLLDVTNYIKRNYAPLPERVQALTAHLEGVPELLRQARVHLRDRRIPRPFIETSLDVYRGYLAFYEETLPPALVDLRDGPLYEAFLRANEVATAAVREFLGWLEGASATATDDFAVGERLYRRMVETGEMLDLPLDRLVRIGEEELRRSAEVLQQTVREIDSARSPAEVIRRVSQEHPSAETLVADTRRLLDDLRAFLVARGIVTIPTEVRPVVEETPPFARWAFAMMDTAGPFEEVATESFYYVTPPEPGWSAEQKEAWLSKFDYYTLKNVSIHEAYPGHYVHFLHVKAAPSRPARIFTSYSFSEGWAHYAEEMMVQEGVDSNPKFRLAQILDALIRNVRYLAAIRMHRGEISLDQATQMFVQHAFMEELPARKEAVRGTFDPGYLNYTLGKLMLRRLRADYESEQGADFSLRRFHDVLLRLGAPPIPLARRALLRQAEGALL
jgi:uncharacterized protein (DUF885 family)